jgi:tetratricopeptide (TPR) repeat protein
MRKALQKLKKYQEIIKLYAPLLASDSTNAEAFYHTGAALSALGNESLSISYFKDALKIDPGMEIAFAKLIEDLLYL